MNQKVKVHKMIRKRNNKELVVQLIINLLYFKLIQVKKNLVNELLILMKIINNTITNHLVVVTLVLQRTLMINNSPIILNNLYSKKQQL